MASYLRVRQPTITRMEQGQAESGPTSALLDLLQADLDAARGPSPPPPVSGRVA